MQPCPNCDTLLPTLDRPCPVCADDDRARGPFVFEYSKTFAAGGRSRATTAALVDTVNTWLAEQPGVLVVHVMLHANWRGKVAAVTLTCKGEPDPVDFHYQIERTELGRTAGPGGAGAALNRWLDANPHRRRVNYWTVDGLWVLFLEAKPAPIVLPS